jgi:pimeloyl-ACP methyl ester carboxylesterase
MEKRIGDAIVDVTLPERLKFTLPIVFVHGVWATSACWRKWAADFSNLGWECWAANFPGRRAGTALADPAALTLDRCIEALAKICDAAPRPPIVVAHGFGALIAGRLASRGRLRTLVAISARLSTDSKDSRALQLFRLRHWLLLLMRSPIRPPTKDLRRTLLAGLSKERARETLAEMVAESGRLVREFFDRRFVVEPFGGPLLIVAGKEDPIISLARAEEGAAKLGADFTAYSDFGHWLIGQDGSETIVREIHRRLVQRLGEEIFTALPQAKEEEP